MSKAIANLEERFPNSFRPLGADFDILVIPDFFLTVSTARKKFDAAEVCAAPLGACAILSNLKQSYPVRRAGEPILPRTVQWVEGSNEALRYRGNTLNRTKIWLQRGRPEIDKVPYYYYTGVQWEVVLAQASWDDCPLIGNEVIPALDNLYESIGAQKAHQCIVTSYNDETCGIGKHFDKPKSIAASDEQEGGKGASLITVVKLGEARPFEIYKLGQEETPAWSEKVPSGAAVIMTLEANLKTKHAVPMLDEKVGESGSLVFRTMAPESIYSIEEVQKKVEDSRRTKARARAEKRPREA